MFADNIDSTRGISDPMTDFAGRFNEGIISYPGEKLPTSYLP